MCLSGRSLQRLRCREIWETSSLSLSHTLAFLKATGEAFLRLSKSLDFNSVDFLRDGFRHLKHISVDSLADLLKARSYPLAVKPLSLHAACSSLKLRSSTVWGVSVVTMVQSISQIILVRLLKIE